MNPTDNIRQYFAEFEQKKLSKKKEKRDLRKLSLYAGCAILGCVLLQSILVGAVELFGLTDLYLNNSYFATAIDIFVTVFGMLVPFAFFGEKMRKVSQNPDPLPLEKTYKPVYLPLGVVAGVGLCLAASIAAGILTTFIQSFSAVELSSPDLKMAEGTTGIILTFVRIALTAAVIEELSVRGFIMGNLRYYGDAFAIAVSSIVFSLMHGNLIQSPFALVAGFILGYLSVKTGSLWTGIIIHALNNGISVAVYYLTDIFGETAVTSFYVITVYGLIFAGTVCLGILIQKTGSYKLASGGSCLKTGEKVVAFFTTPTMIISVIYMLFVTATYVNLK